MKFVMISPHFPAHHSRYVQALVEQGAEVFGLADEPAGWLRPELSRSLSGYYQVADLHRYDDVYRMFGKIIWEHGRIDRLDSLNEYWLELEAHLRSDFNIPGIQRDGIDQVKKKSEMKKIFRSLGLDCARGRPVQDLHAALETAAELAYPLVLKPDIGVGANQTFAVENEVQLCEALASDPLQNWILEEYIDGEIWTFDGLTNQQGQAVFSTSMVYSQGIMDVVLEDNHVSFYTLRDIPPDIAAWGQQLLKAFDVRSRFFHFEFFRCRDGSLKALEVNMRPPGGPSIDMFNYAHNLDLYREWANVLIHNHFNSPVERLYYCAYAGRKNSKNYRHSHSQIVQRGKEALLAVGEHPSVFRRAMGDRYYLFRAESEAEIQDLIAFIQAEDV